MHQIQLDTIRLYAYHGCLKEESLIGSNYEVDVMIKTNFTEAAITDDLSKTVDYCEVFDIVKEEMNIRANLLENVALRIVKRMKNTMANIEQVSVKITKLNPPMNGNVKGVSIIIEE